MGLIQPIKSQSRIKVWGGKNSLCMADCRPAGMSVSCLCTRIRTWPRTHTISLPASQALRLRLELYHLPSWVSSLPPAELRTSQPLYLNELVPYSNLTIYRRPLVLLLWGTLTKMRLAYLGIQWNFERALLSNTWSQQLSSENNLYFIVQKKSERCSTQP